MSWRARSVIGGAIVLSALLHCAPVFVLWQATGRELPAWSSADPYLYLTLSRLHPDGHGMFRNPWYGNQGLASGVLYFRFVLPLRLFHWLSMATGGEARALIAWHLLMNLAIGGALVWALRAVTRDPYALLLTFLGVMLLEATALVDLRQILTGRLVWIYGPPFFRAFSPQVSIPMVFAALGATLRWIRTGHHRWLGLIVLMQFGALVTFPYAAPIILGTLILSTGATLVLGVGTKGLVQGAVAAVVISIGIDLLWFFSTGAPIRFAGSRPAFGFDLSFLHIGRALTLPVLLGLGILALPQMDKTVRAALGALAITIGLAQIADAFVSPTMALGGHFGYFFGLAVSMSFVAVVLATYAMFGRRAWHALASTAAVAILVFALLDARAVVAAWRPYNVANGQLARILASLKTGDGDLVAMPVHGFRTRRAPVYWEASWVPLTSRATVLYSRAGNFGLPLGSSEELDRLATYLFLCGEDAKSLEAILSGPPDTPEQHFIAGWEREGLIHESSTRATTLAEVRRELEPRMAGLIQSPTPGFLLPARRVIVADYRDEPIFRGDRIARLITVDQVLDSGAWRVRVGHVEHDAGAR
jgi:hypothetical protein